MPFLPAFSFYEKESVGTDWCWAGSHSSGRTGAGYAGRHIDAIFISLLLFSVIVNVVRGKTVGVMAFILSVIKDMLGYVAVYAVVILLFVLYYFAVQKYWFLCSVLTIIIFGVIRIFASARKKWIFLSSSPCSCDYCCIYLYMHIAAYNFQQLHPFLQNPQTVVHRVSWHFSYEQP